MMTQRKHPCDDAFGAIDRIDLDRAKEADGLRITPAVLRAAAAGDLTNALIAASPGGIERQEAEGQASLRRADRLPKQCNRTLFEAMGVTFGADADDLFVHVTLPAGWKVTSTSHHLYSKLVDEQGRERATIGYKAAFYDRWAYAEPIRRFNINPLYCNAQGESVDFDSTHEAKTVTDCGREVIRTAPLVKPRGFDQSTRNEWEAHGKARDAARVECEAWLAERYPDWKNPLAYWDVA